MKYVSDEVNKFKKLGINSMIPDNEYQDNIQKNNTIHLQIIHDKEAYKLKVNYNVSVSIVKDNLQIYVKNPTSKKKYFRTIQK